MKNLLRVAIALSLGYAKELPDLERQTQALYSKYPARLFLSENFGKDFDYHAIGSNIWPENYDRITKIFSYEIAKFDQLRVVQHDIFKQRHERFMDLIK